MGKSFSAGMFDDKLQEVMKLLDEQGVESSEVEPIQAEPSAQDSEEHAELLDQDVEGLLTNHAAFVEYSMMMKQWEALMEDYERREAEEEAARKVAEGSVD